MPVLLLVFSLLFLEKGTFFGSVENFSSRRNNISSWILKNHNKPNNGLLFSPLILLYCSMVVISVDSIS